MYVSIHQITRIEVKPIVHLEEGSTSLGYSQTMKYYGGPEGELLGEVTQFAADKMSLLLRDVE